MDKLWYDNVEPLLEALNRLGIAPVSWAGNHDAGNHDFAPFFKEGTRELVDELTGIEPDQIFFACGYMQATANLTGRSWVDQIRDDIVRWANGA